MAQIQRDPAVDDLDGEAADETVEFGIDGKSYEIDLSTANAGKLRDVLAEFVGPRPPGGWRGRSARRPSAPTRPGRRSTGSRTRRSGNGRAHG